jgi:uncharacterized protein with PQ loop repeat
VFLCYNKTTTKIKTEVSMPGRHHHFYLTKKKEKQLINRICAVFAVFMPLTTLPQIIQLYTSHDASGLSLLMWVLYTIGVIPFLLFGVIYHHSQLVVLNILWLIVQVTMITGIIIYS